MIKFPVDSKRRFFGSGLNQDGEVLTYSDRLSFGWPETSHKFTSGDLEILALNFSVVANMLK